MSFCDQTQTPEDAALDWEQLNKVLLLHCEEAKKKSMQITDGSKDVRIEARHHAGDVRCCLIRRQSLGLQLKQGKYR